MKAETTALLAKHHLANRFQFIESEKGLELEHNLTDAEKAEIVEAEYSKTLSVPVDELFVRIMKKVIKMALTKARDTLSEL